MKQVLIADDNPSVHETIGVYLRAEGYEYDSAYDGDSALNMFYAKKYDFVILDIMMPGMFGTEVCKEIRKMSQVPLILLSAKAEEFDRIIGLEIGADDYVTKPFSPREVVTRMKTILRRLKPMGGTMGEGLISIGNLTIDSRSYTVHVEGKKIEVTPKELEILQMLGENLGRVINRDQLLNKVWGYDYIGDTRAVDTHINRLRRKLSQVESKGWSLVSVYGVGYKLEATDDKKA